MRWSESLLGLDISKCHITNRLVSALFATRVMPCVNIVCLDISFCNINNDDALLILNACKELETLNLTCCRGMSRGLKRLYKGFEDLSKLKDTILEMQEE